MDGFNAMIRAIYESPDFSVKGHTATVEDLFVVRHDAAVYIVAVVRLGRLDGTLMSYAYALYDVGCHAAVASAEPAYRGIAAPLPPSEALDRTGGTLGFFDKRRLEKTERELVEGLLMQGSWADEQRESYLTYLRERGGLESPSFRALYEFFADHTTI